MTEQETREKIVEVLKKSREEWEIITPSIGILDEPRVDIEIDKLADALIAAGIGDVSCLREHRVIAEYSLVPDDDNPYIIPNVPLRVAQLYNGEEVEQIVKEREEYKHRAERAERALKIATELGELCAPVEDYIKQAEKELAEERKK